MSKIPKKSMIRQMALKYGYRSGLELDTAADLKKKGVRFTYEEEKIKWEDNKIRTYTPDFILQSRTGKTIIIETKGRFIGADRAKHLSIRKQFGDKYDIRFVFTNSRARLSKASKTTYGQWCIKHGFEYYDKVIPDEWLKE